MKILALHADYLKFEAKKQAIKSAEELTTPKDELKECLVVFMAIEKADEENPSAILENLLEEIRKIAGDVNTQNIVLYPYAHLSSDLGDPKLAVQIMKDAENSLKKEKFTVKRAPFGWYKSFEISCKGHPLSELSRQITVEKKAKSVRSDQVFEMGKELTEEERINLSGVLLLAQALKERDQKAEFGICGFHQGRAYLDVSTKIKESQLPEIEKRMLALAKKGGKLTTGKVQGTYQEEIANDLGKAAHATQYDTISLLAPFPKAFVNDIAEIKALKVLEVASAYWKSNAKNTQLTRVYMVAFAGKEELQDYLNKLVEAEQRDHRKIGAQMKLFSMHTEAPGMPFFHDNGSYIYRQLEQFMIEEMSKLNYEFNKTPLILNKKLWLQSGHWNHYKENMYFTKIDEGDYAVKPMNCPGNILLFAHEPHSYKELPIKAGEFGLVHRHELSGVLSGLFRVRCFTQDDAHVFCTQEQLRDQIVELIDLVHTIYSAFGFEYSLELSTKPEKAMGDPKVWKLAEESLADALKSKKIPYKLNPGDGAFYGPKIDCHVKDALGRKWQCGTIQLDFQMPEKFELFYEGADNQRHRPVMLHRAIYGSFERFIGILIEHYAGKFPLWLSPMPVRIVTVTDRSNDFAQEVYHLLKGAGLRVQLDVRQESLGKKVREAQLDKVNYIVTIGDKEVEGRTLAVRSRDGETRFGLTQEQFLAQLLVEMRLRK